MLKWLQRRFGSLALVFCEFMTTHICIATQTELQMSAHKQPSKMCAVLFTKCVSTFIMSDVI